MPKLPLSGLKVLDLSRVLAGPYCTQILGDLGATVTKIENPHGGDETRKWSPPSFQNQSVYFLSTNRNKNFITLDFKNSKDLQKIYKLVANADIVIENFKVGSLKKYNLHYESLRKLNPKLIYCSITGFGQNGPYAKKPGYDLLIQGMGGLMSISGPNSNTPTKSGIAIVDICTGLYATIGILAALQERKVSGHGQHIDLALLDVSASLLSYIAMNYLTTKQIPKPLGNAHPTIVPYQAFDTKDRPILVCIGNDFQFKNFCKVLGEFWEADKRFETNTLRYKNRRKLISLIQKKLKTKTRKDWLKRFESKGFPFGPINNLQEMAKNPQVIFRKVFTTMDDKRTPCIASPLRFSRTPIKKYKRPPK